MAGLTVSYTHQALAMLAGLFLTPFLLRRLGASDYGLWLIGTQIMAYVGLMDLGVIGLLPREAAYITGSAGANVSDMRSLIGATLRVVLWQLPFVALACAMCWLAFPASWQPLRTPFVIMAAGFLVAFPLRVFPAMLQGLQDLSYVGRIQLTTWAAGLLLTVALVLGRLRLSALAIGWAAGQVSLGLICWRRLRSRYPELLPDRYLATPAAAARRQLGKSVWLSLTSIAHIFVSATDMVIIGRWLGPAAVVPYSCTGKLIAVLGNQPGAVFQATLPALSEVKAGGSREKLTRVVSSLNVSVLMLSGAVVCVVLLVNRTFVRLWVGPQLYAGFTLTTLLLLAMILRHWNTSMSLATLSFGYERRLALTNIADGVVTVGAAIVLVRLLGPAGAPLSSILAVSLVSLPVNLTTVALACGISPLRFAASLGPWFWRFVPVAAVAALVGYYWDSPGLFSLVGAGVALGVIYAVLVIPAGLKTELAPYLVSGWNVARVSLANLKPARVR